VEGELDFKVNDKYSYCVRMTVSLEGTTITSTNIINLHDQLYHYMTDSAAAGYEHGADGSVQYHGHYESDQHGGHGASNY
jgi:hypothetical protein